MKILKIQKNKIYLEDNNEVIDISPDIKSMFSLKEGDDISIKYDDISYEAALAKGLFLLSIKDRTKKNLQNKLNEKFINKKMVDKAVDKLEQLGYVNDFDYAINFIRNSKYGYQRIVAELMSKGLTRNTIEEAYLIIEEADDIDNKKLEKAIMKSNKKEEKKLIEYLLRQGFKLDKIFAKLKELKDVEWKRLNEKRGDIWLEQYGIILY